MILIVHGNDFTTVTQISSKATDGNQNFQIVDNCSESERCVRFCCESKNECLKSDSFNLSGILQAKNLQRDYKIVLGKPQCPVFPIDDVPWMFNEVS
jgi:hypothetical protein